MDDKVQTDIILSLCLSVKGQFMLVVHWQVQLTQIDGKATMHALITLSLLLFPLSRILWVL
jgi:hypothetical protein